MVGIRVGFIPPPTIAMADQALAAIEDGAATGTNNVHLKAVFLEMIKTMRAANADAVLPSLPAPVDTAAVAGVVAT